MRKSFVYRLYPTKEQIIRLENLINIARDIYNSALAERKYAYRSQRKTLHYYDQCLEIKQLRKELPEVSLLNFSATECILRRVDNTFKNFFKRRKAGDRCSYPRFKGEGAFRSVTFPSYGDGIKIRNGRLYIQNVGIIKIRMHRVIEGNIKTVSYFKDCDKWYVNFSNEVDILPLPCNRSEIGIDLGIESFAITSDEEFIINPCYLKNSTNNIRRLHRNVTRKKKNGKNRKRAIKKLSRAHLKIRNQRKDFIHKESRKIINNYGFISVENLPIKHMTKNHHLAFAINDTGWGMFLECLSYKAEWAGRTFVKVNPNGTSQICSRCGKTVQKDLSVRIHSCPYCNLVIHRDLNSAFNILALGRSVWDLTWNSGSCVSQEAINKS
jgi:putative transposase